MAGQVSTGLTFTKDDPHIPKETTRYRVKITDLTHSFCSPVYSDTVTITVRPLSISVQGGIEFDVNPYERSFLPRYSFLYTYATITQIEKKMFIDLVQEMRMGGFSVGLNQKLSNSGGVNFNSIGLGAGLQFENFEFGMAYNFPQGSSPNPFSFCF